MSVGKAGYGSVRIETEFSRAGAARRMASDDHVQIAGQRPGQTDIAADRRRSAQVGTGFDAVGHDAMMRAVQSVDAANADDVRAGAGNSGPHGDQAVGQIDHFGLAGGVLDHGFAFRQAGSHHQVFRARHRHHVREQSGSLQSGRPGMDVAVLDGDFGAHRLQALDVLVHRPGADGATARQRHARFTAARHQRAEHQYRRPHGLDQFIGCHSVVNAPAIEANGIAAALDLHSHLRQQTEHGGDVVEIGNIAERYRVTGQQGQSQQWQGGVLGA